MYNVLYGRHMWLCLALCCLGYVVIYRKTSNIWRTLVGDKIVDHSHVVGASPVGNIFILDVTPGFKGFGNDSLKRVRESF